MTISKMKRPKNNEKGVALVFTLVMLSLLLILALSFALDSMFEQKAAYNSANASSSAFLARAQVRQILTLIENGEDTYDESRLYSHDSSSLNYAYYDMLKERLPTLDVLESTDVVLDGTPKVRWNYITDGSDNHIIGRTAFVVIPDDKVPMASLIDQRAGTPSYPKHNEMNDDETRIGKYVSEINVRCMIPAAITYINNDSMVSSLMDILNLKGTSGDPAVSGFTNGIFINEWLDFDSFFSDLRPPYLNVTGREFVEDSDEGKDFKDNLSLTVLKDPEAFWADTGDGAGGAADTVIDSDELYQRFNLARNWDTADNANDLLFVKNKILLDSDGNGIPDAIDSDSDSTLDTGMMPWSLTNFPNGYGLPWLATMFYKDDGTGNWVEDDSLSGTFPNARARRYQIAANLKDYCDTDNRPTSDVDPTLASTTNWTNTAPSFTGNERTPYINKIGLRVTTRQGRSKKIVWAVVELDTAVELINIYGGKYTGGNLSVEISGTVNISSTINSNTNPDSIPFTTTTDIASSDWKNSGYSNFIPAAFVPAAEEDKNFNTQTGVKKKNRAIDVSVTGFTISKVVLHNGTIAYDYTKSLSNVSPANASATYPFVLIDDGTGERSAWFGFATHDPRQNLNADDWIQLTPISPDPDADSEVALDADPALVFSLTGADPYGGKPNAKNSSFTSGDDTERPSVGGDVDKETGANPAKNKISTAFIRNAPMESPWELGFIHRGVKWQTINLKTYDITKAYQTIPIGAYRYIRGGGLYADGDANILDQIKMIASAEGPQKINLKTQRTANLNALFSKIRLGSTIDTSTMSIDSMAGISPTLLDDLKSSDIDTYSTNIKDKYDIIINPEERRTRASVVDELGLLSGTSDAEREELIGKIVNLTKISETADKFTLIVIAQTIKDIGGTNIGKYSANGRFDNKDCELGKFDVDIDTTSADSKNNVYFDEITAQQKIQVECEREISGKIKITSFKYID